MLCGESHCFEGTVIHEVRGGSSINKYHVDIVVVDQGCDYQRIIMGGTLDHSCLVSEYKVGCVRPLHLGWTELEYVYLQTIGL